MQATSAAQLEAERPSALAVNPGGIPAALKSHPSWVCWRYELNSKGKWTKVPYTTAGTNASSTNAATWTSFDKAVNAYQGGGHGFDGIGIVLTNGFAGVDLDHVLDEDCSVSAWAKEVVEKFSDSYIERSPGGEGLRIFCRGEPRRCGKGGPENRLELYDRTSPRYLTVTGQRWRTSSPEVTENQSALDWLHVHYMAKPAAPAPHHPALRRGALDDDDIIRLASSAANGSKFSRLWSGDPGEDHSSADVALCAVLAFWSRDRGQIDRLFRRSGLMRPKWDERRGQQTYGEMTIDAAMEFATETYSGQSRGDRGDRGDNTADTTSYLGRQRGDSGRLSRGFGEEDASQAESRALALLMPQDFRAPEYPVDALGPLSDVCMAIAEEGQLRPAMAGQSLLASAALLLQAHYNVRTLAGIKPLSLFALTVAESGDGKTTAEQAALAEVDGWQQDQGRRYLEDVADYEQALASRKRGEPKPETPREPYLIMRDGTVEGIRRSFRQGLPSQGVFSSEAAMMLSGYGMNADNRAKSAGNFNSLFDNGEISVARGLDGRLQLYDRRLSLHWLIQPEVARAALHDPLLSQIGFWPRFLLAWPEHGKPRLARAFRPEDNAHVCAYREQARRILALGQREDCRGLPVIEPTAEALSLMGKYFERMEQAKTPTSELSVIRPFALRATELAFRVAGVLAEWAGQQEIDAQMARDATKLVAYSLETWRGVFGSRDEAEARQLALALYGWMLRQPHQSVREQAILHIGIPKRVRSKDRRDACLALLQQHGLVDRAGDLWTATGAAR